MVPEPTVFVVDDDPAIRESIRLIAESVGLKVETHACALDFLESYQTGRPGCLVLDVRMPGMSGIQFQKELRQRGIAIPVIFLSGYADVPTAVRAMEGGAVDFIEKPFNDQVLLERIQQAIEQDARRRRKSVPLADALDWVAKVGSGTGPAEELMLALQDGELTARGAPALSFGGLQAIPAGKWLDGLVDWRESTLRCLPHGFTNIVIPRTDLLSLWPLTGAEQADAADPSAASSAGSRQSATMANPYRTGAPGKPTIRHLILAEFRRRARAGEVFPSLSAEAKALADWAARAHPLAPTPTVRTIENQIRDEYRRKARQTPTK